MVGGAIGLGAGVALGQTMANQLSGLNAAAPGSACTGSQEEGLPAEQGVRSRGR